MSYTLINRVEVVRAEDGMIDTYVNSHDNNLRPYPSAYERKRRGDRWSALSFPAGVDPELIAQRLESIARDYEGRDLREARKLSGIEAYDLWRSRFKRVGLDLRGCRASSVYSGSPSRSLNERSARPGVKRGQLVRNVSNEEFASLRGARVCYDLNRGRSFYIASSSRDSRSRRFKKTASSNLCYTFFQDPTYFADDQIALEKRERIHSVEFHQLQLTPDEKVYFSVLVKGSWVPLSCYYIHESASAIEPPSYLYLMAKDGPEFIRRIREDIPGMIIVSIPASLPAN